MKKGGYVFPSKRDPTVVSNGLTLRDYFAGQALAGLCSHDFSDGSGTSEDSFVLFAKWSYDWADAMIAEREKQNDQ